MTTFDELLQTHAHLILNDAVLTHNNLTREQLRQKSEQLAATAIMDSESLFSNPVQLKQLANRYAQDQRTLVILPGQQTLAQLEQSLQATANGALGNLQQQYLNMLRAYSIEATGPHIIVGEKLSEGQC